jgi:hypothetical protein
MSEMPEEVRELDAKLHGVRFRPAASLEPQLLGRLRRGDLPRRYRFDPWRHRVIMAAVALLTAGAALVFAGWVPTRWDAAVTVDRCCYDLDGGGPADDGVLVLAQRDSKVHRLRVYEDLDGSTSFTPGDLVRLDRGEKPALLDSHVDRLTTTRRCCVDLDGGGPEDDGLLVIGTPPDRVFMAAIYETDSEGASPASKDGWLLR